MEGAVGVDIVEVERVQRLVHRWGDRFLRRVFTEGELATCLSRARPAESLAARFAAKEAFVKAWSGAASPGWRDVEVLMEGSRPGYRLHGPAAEPGLRARLSLSHTHQFAVAVAWLYREPEA